MRNRARVLAALLGLASGLAHSDGSRAMDSSTRDRIVAAAARDRHWNAGDIEVRDNAELDRGACHFFLAVNAKTPSHEVGNYAALGDGRVAGVDVSGNYAAAAILKSCGADAPADWWASVVARFSSDVGGLVLTADGNPFAIRKIRDAGVDFKPPTLTRNGDAATLTFFTMDIGANRAFLATVELSASGALTVQTKPVRK